MSKTLALIRREFIAFAWSKMFVIGTLFGPILISLLIVLPYLFSETGGTRELVIVDATGGQVGREVAAELDPGGEADGRYAVQVIEAAPEAADSVRGALRARAAAKEVDGYLWLPPDITTGAGARYEGRYATSFRDLREMRGAVSEAVREERLRAYGIDPYVLSEALAPVEIEATGVREEEPRGTTDDLFIFAQFMGMALFLVLLLYGNAILRGVREEKENRMVELILSSVRPEQLMAGKVLGIGLAGLLQVAVWVAFAALAMAFGDEITAAVGGSVPDLPRFPWQTGVIFLAYFAGGYFLYACIFAALGAVATSGQEAQNLQYPAIVPLFVGYLMIFAVTDDPGGTLAVVGTLIPLTSPLVMPVRAALTPVPWGELALSMALLVATCWAFLWIAGRVHRVTILSTGQRPSMKQLWRWVRAG